MYSVFNDLQSDDQKYRYAVDPFELIEAYNTGGDALDAIVEKIVGENAALEFSLRGLAAQIDYKVWLISAIESYLMANWDEAHPEYVEEAVAALARGTLAYFLATEEQRLRIVKLFTMLAQNIAETVPEIRARIVFGKTLFGLQNAVLISSWLIDSLPTLALIKNEPEILTLLWPLLEENIHNSAFANCDKPEAMQDLAARWMEGKSYDELHKILINAGARRKAKTRRFQYDIEDVVDICDNGFSFDAMLLVGALIELLQDKEIEGIDEVVALMRHFQKRFRYGLPTQLAVLVYELGFTDRVVALDICQLLRDIPPDRQVVIQALKDRKDEFDDRLDIYPALFSDVYRVVVS